MTPRGAAVRPVALLARRSLFCALQPAASQLIWLLAVTLAALPAVWPLTRFRFLSSHDGTYHLLRLVALDRLARQGELFPGWFPDFASGYGYPLLSFYPPLSYYPALAGHLLGLGYVDATKAALAVPLVLSGIGAYLLGRDLFGSRWAGWLTAVGFMYAPYHLIDTYVRAILSECWAFPFLPLTLWSLRRAALGSRAHVGLAALWWAGLILAHNVIALFFTPLALLFGIAAAWSASGRRQALARVGGAFALALVVGAAYWLPALAENRFVSTGNFNTPAYRPEEHLNALDELVATELFHEYAQSPFRFGLVQTTLALLGLLAWPWARGRRLGIAFGALLTLLFGALLTSLLAWVWSAIPLVAYVQFPTRLLSLAALGTALLTGALALFPIPARWVAGLAGALLLIAAGVATIDPPPLWPRDEDLSVATIARFEHDSGIIGTTTAAEYLPVWARAGFVPPTEGFAPPVGTKDDPAVGAAVVAAGPLSLRLETTADRPAPLRLHAFYFPGWRATVDGRPVEPRPSTPLGLLTVDLPPGTHVVEVAFGPTPLRLFCLALSLGGLGLGMALVAGRRGVVALGSGLLALTIALRLVQSAAAAAWTAIPPVPDTPVALAGGRLRASGAFAEAELFWLAAEEAPSDRRFGMRLVDAAGQTVAEKWSRPIFSTSTTEAWHRNELVRDLRVLRLPDGAPAGRYRVDVALRPEEWHRAGDVVLASPHAAPRPLIERTARFGETFLLEGITFAVGGRRADPAPAADAAGSGGAVIDLTLHWQLLRDVDQGYTVFVHLLDPLGRRVAQQDNQPGGGFAPTTSWQRGVAVADPYRLRLPRDALPGVYQIDIGWYLLADLERLPLNGGPASAFTAARLRVPGPVRPPEEGIALFDGRVALLEAARAGDSLDLVWQLRQPVWEPIHAFVHVRDAAGQIVRQADGAPLRGNYPFALWSVGETVRERRWIGEVPLDGTVAVGLYIPERGVRLMTADGQEMVVIR
ncbi:MAG: hypothetical protein RMM58_08850 [Chloroflexota bacterium]|nr:hypothetical protein [Dehalococcoidia bacterium]MDW8253973.1 hypothetical protein [Chloroflexota bacterium]